MSEFVVRRLTPEELSSFVTHVLTTFGADRDLDPEAESRLRALLPLARCHGGFAGATMVATAAAFPLRLTVPGGDLAMAGLTCVTVAPTHQRRGLLRRLLAAHLADAEAAGEAVSGLYASQGGLYGRFGYGVAAESDVLSIRGPLAPPTALDDLALLAPEEAARRLPALDRAAAAARPGMYVRDDAWWQWRRIADRPFARRGRSTRRFLIARRGERDTGYAIYRQRPGFADGQATGVVDLEELIGLDAEAEATLWHAVTTIDLFPTVEYDNAPVDHGLNWRAADPRRVVRRRRADTLWLRLHAPNVALAARRYAVEDVLVIAVDDPLAPSTRWRLAVVDGRAEVTPTAASPDLVATASALGALYLGGASAAALARADLLRGEPAAIARAERLFAWPVAPWCAEQF
jgi:predicted acetyltransferase